MPQRRPARIINTGEQRSVVSHRFALPLHVGDLDDVRALEPPDAPDAYTADIVPVVTLDGAARARAQARRHPQPRARLRRDPPGALTVTMPLMIVASALAKQMGGKDAAERIMDRYGLTGGGARW
jgi:hypothetical protein